MFELKENSKWSTDPEEKKAAINELSTPGENAISELLEIMNVSVYEDFKNACAEAIRSIQARSKEVKINEETTTSNYNINNNTNNSVTDVINTTTVKNQKNEESKSNPRTQKEKQEEG